MGETFEADRALAFGMLGPLRVAYGGDSLPLGGRQQRAVLARLLVADGSSLSVEQLADAVWGERPPTGYVSTIQTYVFHLRHALEPGRDRGAPGRVLVTENGRYRLMASAGSVDAQRFERATEEGFRLHAEGAYSGAVAEFSVGLGLWRGEVLADLVDYAFVAPVAARLVDRQLAAVEAKLDAELALGRHAAVLGELDELVARYPLSEQLQRHRILALYRCGRSSEALSAYDGLRHQLADELGLDPGPALQLLHQQLLTHDPALQWWPIASLSVTTPPLAGRDASAAGRLAADATEPGVSRLLLEICTLGDERITINGIDVVATWSPRTMSLLIYLLVHRNAPQRREHLSEVFWPNSTDAQARTNLRRELHAIKAIVPMAARWIVANKLTLMWRMDDQCQVDVIEFETAVDTADRSYADGDTLAFRAAAKRAVALYRGDLAPGLYGDWLARERDRLRRLGTGMIDRLVDDAESDESVGDAIELLLHRLDLEPLEEAAYRTLIRLYGRAGDRAAAVRTYHRCVSVLERELGVAPVDATTREYERISGHGTSEKPAGTLAVPRFRDHGPVPLVGREAENGWLLQWWQRGARDGAGFVLVSGEAGVGKSRLVDELFREVQRDGAVCASARCFAAQGRLPLAPVAEWLRHPAMRIAVDSIDPTWRREVDRLVPSSASEQQDRPSPLADGWQRRRFFEGLTHAVLATKKPTLLVLDDIHWCDDDTLVWLQMALRLGSDLPLLVATTSRVDELAENQSVARTLETMRASGQVADLELSPLDADESAALARVVLDDTDEIDALRLHDVTGGYPLFVIESARARMLGGEPGQTPRVRAILGEQLAKADTTSREIAGLAAAFGRNFSVDLLVAASDFEPDTVIEAVDDLWRRRIIREDSSTSYDFVHDLIRDTAYAQIGSARRKKLHHQIARALHQINVDDLGPVAAALADQHERAGELDLAVAAHLRAAEEATAVFANLDAIRHYRRAATLLMQTPGGTDRDRSELHIRQAISAPLNAQYGYASTELQQSLERSCHLAEQLEDTRAKLMGLLGLFGVRFVQGHIRESYQIGTRSLELIAAHPELADQAHFAVAGSSVLLGAYERAAEHFARSEQIGMREPLLLGTRTDVFSPAWSAHALYLLDREDAALEACERAVTRAEALEHPYSIAVAYAYEALTHQLRLDIERMDASTERLIDHCGRYDIGFYPEWGSILRGWNLGGSAGATLIDAALGRLRAIGALVRIPYFQALLGQTLLNAGMTDAAGVVLDSARALATANDELWWQPELLRLEARRHPEPQRTELLQRAIALARQHNSPLLQRRALDDLG